MRHNDTDQDLIVGINITPMVDITLVLLIIFMVTAHFISLATLRVNLPKITQGVGETANIRVTLKERGELYLKEDRIDLAGLKNNLSVAVKVNPDVHVTLAADRSLPYGQVVTVLDTIKASGASRVGLASEQ